MNRLAKMVAAATPSTAVQLRPRHYGAADIERFLRDVLAMANANAQGTRYIIVGVDADARGRKQVVAVPADDFGGKPSYQGMVAEFIEPPIRVRYKPVLLDGKRVGVFEIPDCHDRPYMMRIDYSETLRRGDAYARQNDTAIKLGRRHLQDMFARKFRESVSAERIEIGFPGDIIHKTLRLPTLDLSAIPSAIANAKLQQLLDAHRVSAASTDNTMVARLTHARLFGSDSPYESRSPAELMQEMAEIKRKYHHEDEHFLFEEHGGDLQIVVYNQGDDVLRDASLSLVMPNHNCFYVSSRLPHVRHDGKFMERSAAEQADYPAVSLRDDSVLVTSTLGDIAGDSVTDAFTVPLRVCVGTGLAGRRLGIRYSLQAANLRLPAKGTLRLQF